MGYLVCQKCRGYYKLQDGELPADFTDKCACGGNLRYAVSIDVVGENTTFHKQQKQNNKAQTEQNEDYKKSKTTETKNKPNFKEDWDKQSKNTKISIGIVGLCCIGIILFVVFGGLLSPNKTNSTANSKTYSGHGLTFNYLTVGQ